MNTDNQPQNDAENRPITAGTTDVNEKPKRPIWVIVLASLGIIAVIAALGIGIFQIAGLAPENISRLGSGIGGVFTKEEKLELSLADEEIQSGDTTELQINYLNRLSEAEGSLTVEFICEVEGITVKFKGEEVPCNQEIQIDLAEGSTALSISSTREELASVGIVTRFTGAETELGDNATITVTNSEIAVDDTPVEKDPTEEEPVEAEEPKEEAPVETEEPEEQAPAETAEPKFITVERVGRVSDPKGTPDLRLEILETGFVNNNGHFVEAGTLRNNQRAAVRFEVINRGTKVVNSGWYFSSLLPTDERFYFQSGTQPALYPGDKIIFELAFNNIERSESLYLNVDPADRIHELSEDNNIRFVEFNVRN